MIVTFLDFDGVLNSAGSVELYHSFIQASRYKNKEEDGKPRDFISFKKGSCAFDRCNASDFDPKAISNLNYLLKSIPDLKVVISSTWRMGASLEELKGYFNFMGLPSDRIIGATPITKKGHRGTEILMWLKEHPEVTKYTIIDDDADMDGTDPEAFWYIDNYNGLTYRETVNLIKYYEGRKYYKVHTGEWQIEKKEMGL